MTDAALAQRLDRYINDHKESMMMFLAKLVQIPSVTHPPGGDEYDVQMYMAQAYKQMGLITDVFEPTDIDGIRQHEGWWAGLDYHKRPNVVGVLKGSGGGKNLILNGHCDVVSEGDAALWELDPFSGQVVGNRLYGRGSVDMKGGIAAMTMAVDCLQRCGVRLKGDVILESVVNEELGGYNGTLACILRGYQADGAIVTEPTDLKIAPQTKGGQGYKITVPGIGAHQSFWWKGVSALDKAILLKRAIEEYEKRRCEQTKDVLLYADPKIFPTRAITDCVYAFRSGDPMIMGVPNETVMELWIDVLPGEDLEQVAKEFENMLLEICSKDDFLKDHPITIERADIRPIYPTGMDPNHGLVASVRESHKKTTGHDPIVCGFEAACDAMIFNKYSKTPAMVFGAGQLELAHRPNEYMDLTQYMQSIRILALTMMDFCGVSDGL